MNIEEKVVLITGGTSGIGLATAKLFIQKGAYVMLTGRSNEKAQAALQTLGHSNMVRFIQGNVARPDECRQIVEATYREFGRIDTLINSAGIYFEKAIESMNEVDFDQIMDINIKGTYFMCKYASKYIKKSSYGAIVNVSSDAGINGNYLCSAYCASKGAVTVFTKALALELAPYNVRVNCICPGDIDTPLTQGQFQNESTKEADLKIMSALYPLGRIGRASEAAEVIYFLASEKASFVTGAAWLVDGGITAC